MRQRIFAHNGSLLAHAHRDQRAIRSARTESATFSSAYVSYMNGDGSKPRSQTFNKPDNGPGELSDPDSIIYESRTSDHVTVITPIAHKILLAVTGSIPSREAPARGTAIQDDSNGTNNINTKEDALEASSSVTSRSSPPPPSLHLPPDCAHSEPNGFLEPLKPLLEELGSISDQLSSVLREEMGRMRWPEGA